MRILVTPELLRESARAMRQTSEAVRASTDRAVRALSQLQWQAHDKPIMDQHAADARRRGIALSTAAGEMATGLVRTAARFDAAEKAALADIAVLANLTHSFAHPDHGAAGAGGGSHTSGGSGRPGPGSASGAAAGAAGGSHSSGGSGHSGHGSGGGSDTSGGSGHPGHGSGGGSGSSSGSGSHGGGASVPGSDSEPISAAPPSDGGDAGDDDFSQPTHGPDDDGPIDTGDEQGDAEWPVEIEEDPPFGSDFPDEIDAGETGEWPELATFPDFPSPGDDSDVIEADPIVGSGSSGNVDLSNGDQLSDLMPDPPSDFDAGFTPGVVPDGIDPSLVPTTKPYFPGMQNPAFGNEPVPGLTPEPRYPDIAFHSDLSGSTTTDVPTADTDVKPGGKPE